MLSRRHTTREGDSLLVGQMETAHLLYTIRVMLRKAAKLVRDSRNEVNAYEARLYKTATVSPEEAADAVEQTVYWLAPYFLEVFFRLEEIANSAELLDIYLDCNIALQACLGRKGRLAQDVRLIPEVLDGEVVYEDEDDDDWMNPVFG